MEEFIFMGLNVIILGLIFVSFDGNARGFDFYAAYSAAFFSFITALVAKNLTFTSTGIGNLLLLAYLLFGFGLIAVGVVKTISFKEQVKEAEYDA